MRSSQTRPPETLLRRGWQSQTLAPRRFNFRNQPGVRCDPSSLLSLTRPDGDVAVLAEPTSCAIRRHLRAASIIIRRSSLARTLCRKSRDFCHRHRANTNRTRRRQRRLRVMPCLELLLDRRRLNSTFVLFGRAFIPFDPQDVPCDVLARHLNFASRRSLPELWPQLAPSAPPVARPSYLVLGLTRFFLHLFHGSATHFSRHVGLSPKIDLLASAGLRLPSSPPPPSSSIHGATSQPSGCLHRLPILNTCHHRPIRRTLLIFLAEPRASSLRTAHWSLDLVFNRGALSSDGSRVLQPHIRERA